MNAIRQRLSPLIEKRLTAWEAGLLLLSILLYFYMSNAKGPDFAIAGILSLSVLLACVILPRAGVYTIILIVFLESYIGVINQVAIIAEVFEITGFRQMFQGAYFYILAPALVLTLLLGYAISRGMSNPAPFKLLGTEKIMLIPAMLCLSFLPLSIYYGHPYLAVIADCLLGLFFVAGIIIGRVFFLMKGMFYVLLNYLCIANHLIGIGYLLYALFTGLLTQNVLFVMWSGRYLMGQTDFNMFLVPILFCVLLYRGDALPRGWRIFYLFSFWAFLLRLLFALFRGPIAAVVLGFVIIYFLSPHVRRIRIRRFGFRCLVAAVILVALFLTVIPYGDMIIDTLFVQRFWGLFGAGGESETAGLSLKIRMIETLRVWDEIMEYPILGHGPGAEISLRVMANEETKKQAFVHNGYLWLWHKFGILGPLLIIPFLLFPFIKGLQLLKKKLTPDENAFLIGVMATTACIFPAIITNTIIARPQGALMLVICFAFLLTIERRVMRDEGLDIRPYI